MDPNAALEKIRSIVRFTRGPSADMQTPSELLEDLVEAVDALDGWLSKGGFPPRDWERRNE